MIGAARPATSPRDERDHAHAPIARASPRERRPVGVADRDRERVGRVVGLRQLGERRAALDHLLDLGLRGAAGAADRALDLLRRVGGARHAALAGGEQHDAARLADGERRAGVGAEVELLDRHRVGPVLVDQLA